MNEQTTNPLEIKKIVSWTIIIIVFTEWFSFFLQFLLNLFDLDLGDMPAEHYVMIFAVLLSPFLSWVFAAIGHKHSRTLKRVMGPVALVLLGISGLFNWIFYAMYYQIGSAFPVNIDQLTSVSEILGMLGNYTPNALTVLLISNFLIFFALVPVLFNIATDGTSKIQFTHETNIGAIIASVYLFLRPGSIVGVPYRFVFIALIGIAAWLLGEIFARKGPDAAPEEVRKGFLITSRQIPKFVLGGLAVLVVFSLITPSSLMNGLLYNTWVWIFLAVSAGISEIMILKSIEIRSHWIGLAWLLGIAATNILLIWGLYEPLLIRYQPIILSIDLALLGLLIPMLRPFFKKKRKNVFLDHPSRQIGFSIPAALTILLPLLAGLYIPLTTWVALGLFGLIYALLFIALYKSIKEERVSRM